MQKLKSIQQFNEENCLSKEQLEKVQGGKNGMDININPRTDDVVHSTTGPFKGECDCMATKDGLMWNDEFVTSSGNTLCE